jgi:very-short-patch-repair endonuclease
VWREARLIVELDGFETHGTKRAVERDRNLTAKGWRTVRVTRRQMQRPDELLRNL